MIDVSGKAQVVVDVLLMTLRCKVLTLRFYDTRFLWNVVRMR